MLEMHFDFPDHLSSFIQERVIQGGYGSANEYVLQLIESERRKLAQANLEAELLKGLASGPAVEMTAKHWDQIRTEVERRISARVQ
jgi:antitoxin ParD1/3/4